MDLEDNTPVDDRATGCYDGDRWMNRVTSIDFIGKTREAQASGSFSVFWRSVTARDRAGKRGRQPEPGQAGANPGLSTKGHEENPFMVKQFCNCLAPFRLPGALRRRGTRVALADIKAGAAPSLRLYASILRCWPGPRPGLFPRLRRGFRRSRPRLHVCAARDPGWPDS